MTVREIDRDQANAVIIANHYSRKVYAASTVHLGVWIGDLMIGVLQFGFAMNPASAPSVVAGTAPDEYLELNRMWLDDAAPRNSESRAISLAMAYLRQSRPNVGWVQSFADERCGRNGVVYQAAGFSYHGEHTAIFWMIDGTFYHNSLMTRDPSLTPAAAFCQGNKERAVAHHFRQFRYLRFLRPAFRRRCLWPQLPFPKHAGEGSRETRPPTRGEGQGQFLPPALMTDAEAA